LFELSSQVTSIWVLDTAVAVVELGLFGGFGGPPA
jgi:hypothetical protein